MSIINQYKIKVILMKLMKLKNNQKIRLSRYKMKMKKETNTMKLTKLKKIKMKIFQTPHKKV